MTIKVSQDMVYAIESALGAVVESLKKEALRGISVVDELTEDEAVSAAMVMHGYLLAVKDAETLANRLLDGLDGNVIPGVSVEDDTWPGQYL